MINPDFTCPLGRILMTGLLTLILSACGDSRGTCSGSVFCSSSGSGSGSGSGTPIGPSVPTGIITHRDFVVLYSDQDPQIFDMMGVYTQKTVTISIHADDIFDLPVSNATVNFATEWGTFTDSDSCVLSNGSCTVDWIPGDPATAPFDCLVSFTAFAVGEEQFADSNGNDLFDLLELFEDLEEPYLDLAGNGVFDAICNADGVCETIDIVNFDGTTPGFGSNDHDPADGFYNGSLCADVAGNPACNTVTSTVIHARSELRVRSPSIPPLPPTTCP